MHVLDVTEGLQRDEGKDKHGNENNSSKRERYISTIDYRLMTILVYRDSFCFLYALASCPCILIMTGHWFRMKYDEIRKSIGCE